MDCIHTCLAQSMDLKYCDACTTVDLRFVPGGMQAMHRLYVLVCTKHGQASGMQRRVTILTCRLNTEVKSNFEG